MATELQKQYKSILDEIDTIKKDNGDLSSMSEVAIKKYTETLDKADVLFKKLELEDKEAKIRELAGKSAGSFVAASFVGEVPPGDGEMPGISMTEKGELYALDGAYKGMAEEKLNFLKSGKYTDSIVNYIRAKGDKNAMKGDAMKILSEGADPAGAFWVPPNFNPELIKKMAPYATVRPNAKVYTTGTDHITFPAVSYNGSVTDDTYAQLFTSGVRFSWRGSIGSTADYSEATNPIAGQINIPVQLATAAIFLTREMAEDNSFDILGYISDLGAEAFAMGEENAFTAGTGAGQPRGFLQHPSNFNTTASTGQYISYSTYNTVAGTTYWGNMVLTGSTLIAWGGSTSGVIGTEGQLPPQYEANSKWFASKATYTALRALNVGTATLPQWGFGSNWPNYTEGLNQQPLLGYPIVKNQFMPTAVTGHTYMVLGDMSGYFIVDRVGLSVEVFREVYGLRDQIVVYMRKRVGGDLVQYWKMKALSST